MKFIRKCLKIKFLKSCKEISSNTRCSGFESALKVDKMNSKRHFVNEIPNFNSNKNYCLQRDMLRERMVEIINEIESKQSPVGKHRDSGLYVGIGGIAYMFFHLSTSPIFIDRKEDFLSKGIEYIAAAEKMQNKRSAGDPADETGFLLGGSGVHAVAACLYRSAGNKKSVESNLSQFICLSNQCKLINFLPYGSDELLVGRAGYVAGALWINKVFTKTVIPDDVIISVCKSMYDSGVEYSKSHQSQSPLMYSYYNTEYLGAAHGLSTILQMIISVPKFMLHYPQTSRDIRAAVDFLLSLQTPEGNFPCAMDEVGQSARPAADELVHWCHGAPGVVYLMAKAYLIWNDQKYLNSCIKCGDLVWKKGLLKKGPGICHGVAGSGYVFLLLYRLTKEKKYLYRAEQFAEFLFSKQFKSARTPDCPYSLYEGLAGTVCFLNDVLVPDSAVFPFLDVF